MPSRHNNHGGQQRFTFDAEPAEPAPVTLGAAGRMSSAKLLAESLNKANAERVRTAAMG